MSNNNNFEVIIIGGSYTGLSAAMGLGRALRKTLVIDNGLPCNRQTPHSHNFITQDGKPPKEISDLARSQVLKYPSIEFHDGLAVKGKKTVTGFEITTSAGHIFYAKKLIFATGIKDLMPDIKGFSECWGISIIHCPYCHGYEYSHKKTGILANGEVAFEFGKLISNWTKELTIFTNGTANIAAEQIAKLKKKGIRIVEAEIDYFKHNDGHIESILFKNGFEENITAVYARIPFVQHSDIPMSLACELTEQGFIKVDVFQKTSIPGVYAGGDNASPMRSVANAVYAGTIAAATINKELIDDQF